MNIYSGTVKELKRHILTETNKQMQDEIEKNVKEIISDIEKHGDEAVFHYIKKFDKQLPLKIKLDKEDISKGYEQTNSQIIKALKKAKKNIMSFHLKQKQNGFLDAEKPGVIRGQLVLPIETVGIYVPGGTAQYPSSVLMNAIPAKIAGVKKIVMITPSSNTELSPSILAAAKIAEVDEIYQVGGVQGIAALAYGTETIPKVDKIVGPGNIYVATAKKVLFGTVAIDMIAGPSEIVVLADQYANPHFIAADLLSQAEHDVLARAILITTSEEIASKVQVAIKEQLDSLPRKDIASQSLQNHGAIFIVKTVEEQFELMNEIAPEHLEIQLEEAMTYLSLIKNAGSVFIGPYASEPLGDYMAGANHVLPTNGTARFFSPLGVEDFVKRTAFINYTKEALEREQEDIVHLAKEEGLDAHARAIQIRFEISH